MTTTLIVLSLLPTLVKQSLALLLTQLQPNDRVAIVTYAGNAGTALEPTAASEKGKILGVIERRVALLNPEKLGLNITALVSIETNDHSASWIADFASRINPRSVNKRVLESLAAAGAFDGLEDNRARAHGAV